jgi:hypothetical protein
MDALRFLVETAHAQVGSGPGVDEMWGTICSVLPYCNLGTGAVFVFVGSYLAPLLFG